jgi:hypothetical protein
MAVRDTPYIEITIRGDEEQYPLLLDVNSFLYDFNLLYEFARIGNDPSYSNYTLSRFSWTRKNRPLSESDQLRVVQLRHESPLLLVVIVAAVPSAVAAIWGMVQTTEKITNWKINREILQLQRDKLRRELSDEHAEVIPEHSRFELQSREAEYFLGRTAERLQRSSIRVKEFDVKLIRGLRPGNEPER